MKKETWKTVIQVIVSILTAALTALGTTSCMGHGPIILWQRHALTNEKAGSTQKKSLPVFIYSCMYKLHSCLSCFKRPIFWEFWRIWLIKFWEFREKWPNKFWGNDMADIGIDEICLHIWGIICNFAADNRDWSQSTGVWTTRYNSYYTICLMKKERCRWWSRMKPSGLLRRLWLSCLG